MLEHTSSMYQRMFESNYSVGFETSASRLHDNRKDHTKWSNPLEVELPNAPSMKIYCLYGHGKETEVSDMWSRRWVRRPGGAQTRPPERVGRADGSARTGTSRISLKRARDAVTRRAPRPL